MSLNHSAFSNSLYSFIPFSYLTKSYAFVSAHYKCYLLCEIITYYWRKRRLLSPLFSRYLFIIIISHMKLGHEYLLTREVFWYTDNSLASRVSLLSYWVFILDYVVKYSVLYMCFVKWTSNKKLTLLFIWSDNLWISFKYIK